MDVRKALVVYNARKNKEHQTAVKTVRSALRKLGVKFKFAVKENATKNMMKGIDLVITVGGDGTFIEASHLIDNDTLILGVNSDPKSSEGVHTMATRFDFEEKLKKILRGDFSVERWHRLSAVLDGKALPPSLNEVYIGTLHQFLTSRYTLIRGGKREPQKSSGVIVSTGCGSTAWYASAGGRPFPRTSHEGRFIIREPYRGRLTPIKTTEGVVDSGLTVESNMRKGCVAIDSTKVFGFGRGSVVTVNLSNKPLHVIVF